MTDELIRKSDALAACAPLYGWSIAAAEELEAAIAALPAVTVGVKPRRLFPILGSRGTNIDYQLVQDHAKQAHANHGQTVERLGERGGLSWCELYAVLHNRKWEKVDTNEAMIACRALEARYLAALEPVAAPDLTDPVTVHANMLRGTIAKPTVEQIVHLYGVDALAKALAPVIVREAGIEPAPAPDYRLAPHLQRIVELAKTAPQWDTVNDRMAALADLARLGQEFDAAPDPACDHCGMDPAAIREAAITECANAIWHGPIRDYGRAAQGHELTAAHNCRDTILALIQKGAAE